MSVTEYSSQRATDKQLYSCLKWCLNQLQLRDWQVELDIGAVPPDGADPTSYGVAIPDTNRLKAKIWINDLKHKQDDSNIYATMIHETLHIFFAVSGMRGKDECPVRILEPLLYELYCKHAKIKPSKVKEGY